MDFFQNFSEFLQVQLAHFDLAFGIKYTRYAPFKNFDKTLSYDLALQQQKTHRSFSCPQH